MTAWTISIIGVSPVLAAVGLQARSAQRRKKWADAAEAEIIDALPTIRHVLERHEQALRAPTTPERPVPNLICDPLLQETMRALLVLRQPDTYGLEAICDNLDLYECERREREAKVPAEEATLHDAMLRARAATLIHQIETRA
jgi:hypothetical protein